MVVVFADRNTHAQRDDTQIDNDFHFSNTSYSSAGDTLLNSSLDVFLSNWTIIPSNAETDDQE